ncbi:MAG: acyltransferase [Rhodospirillales bacterium]|nr:acyltransferase [Rhodospirillales bacterium]MDE2458787.1 acyltransferase [Rhodospirillales bacterium]
MRNRRADIDMAKGFAILLVVFGHLVARQDPQGVHWYEPLRRAVYAFHMPFFLYLSGLVASFGFVASGRRAFWPSARARAHRLLLPFFGLGLLVLAGKLVASRFFFVDHVPASISAGLDGLFWHTEASPALSIWYMFVLFVLSIATLWLLDGQPKRLSWLLAFSLLLCWLPVPAYAYMDRVFAYAPFFLMGAAAGFAEPRWNQLMDRAWPWALAALLAGLIGVALWGREGEQETVMLPLGTLSMLALHGAMRRIQPGRLHGILLFFGRYSFMIYLGNTICIGLAKGMMLRFISWNGAHFLLYAPVLLAAGLFGPIALKHYGFARMPALNRLTD